MPNLGFLKNPPYFHPVGQSLPITELDRDLSEKIKAD